MAEAAGCLVFLSCIVTKLLFFNWAWATQNEVCYPVSLEARSGQWAVGDCRLASRGTHLPGQLGLHPCLLPVGRNGDQDAETGAATVNRDVTMVTKALHGAATKWKDLHL